MAGLVLDASVPLAAVLPGESGTEAALRVLHRVEREGAVVPALWPTEVANALLTAMRRRRVPSEAVAPILARLGALPVEVEAGDLVTLWDGPLHAAIRHGLTVYDATYLDLARRRGLPLATLDTALRRAAEAEGVTLLP